MFVWTLPFQVFLVPDLISFNQFDTVNSATIYWQAEGGETTRKPSARDRRTNGSRNRPTKKIRRTMQLRLGESNLVFLDPHVTPARGHRLSGPTAIESMSRYTVFLHSVALRFPGFGRVSQENRATPRHVPFSALKGGVALQVACWKALRYKGVSQLHCRLSRHRGPLSWGGA